MDYVKPVELVREIVQAAEAKTALPARDLLVRGILSAVFLGYATALALVVVAQGAPPFVGALVFPIGIGLIVLLGLELGTGNYAALSIGMAAGQVTVARSIRNWGWVFAANLIGGLVFATLFTLVITTFGANDGGALGDVVRQVARKKTLAYAAAGLGGWSAALVSGVLCNWLVALGTAVLPYTSRSVIGKIGAIWLPILTFFALGYEHSVVNMFVIPAGIILGAPVSVADWWLWNQVPVTIGNIIGGTMFTGLALWATYGHASAQPAHVPRTSALGQVLPAGMEEMPAGRRYGE
ncbi:MAG: formate/nitrite transporter family protein [Chloroflexi bacterium]|nr:formate/nitrite transporter family protein [Chloroflexota bacterium]